MPKALVNLLRGANLCTQSHFWQRVEKGVEQLVEDSLRFVRLASEAITELRLQCQERNRRFVHDLMRVNFNDEQSTKTQVAIELMTVLQGPLDDLGV